MGILDELKEAWDNELSSNENQDFLLPFINNGGARDERRAFAWGFLQAKRRANAEIERLTAALGSFIAFANRLIDRSQTPKTGDLYSLDSGSEHEVAITIEDFKLARQVLTKKES